MKKILVVALSFCALSVSAQKKPAAKPAAKKPATAGVQMKNQNDSVSYAVGMSVANFYTQQGIRNINPEIVARAISDVMNKRSLPMNDEQAQTCIMKTLNPSLGKTIEEGERFLAQNKKKAGVKTTPSGLQYEVIREGNGIRPVAVDTVEVNYAGTLINGTEFDNSYKRGSSISFPLNGVIRGWTEGVQLMSEGSKFRFYIPYMLGYGMNEAGSIPAGSTLIFDVELIKVKKAR